MEAELLENRKEFAPGLRGSRFGSAGRSGAPGLPKRWSKAEKNK